MKTIKRLFRNLLFWLKTKPFHRINKLDTFRIVDEFGSAGFMKTCEIKAICLDSQDGTYEKSREYAFEMHQRVIKTC